MFIKTNWMKKPWGKQVKLNFDHEGVQGVVVVALDGWDLSKYENRKGYIRWPGTEHMTTSGITTGKQIRLSLNGPLKMTYQDWRMLAETIDNIYTALEGETDV